MNQTLNEFELIITNSGSTDNNGQISKEYLKKIKELILYRLKIRDKNLSEIKVWKLLKEKIYIGFVDGDYFIDKNMYENLYKRCIHNNLDTSIIGLREVNENQDIVRMLN